MLKDIEGCENVQEEEVSEWLIVDVDQYDPRHQFLSEGGIVAECSKKWNNKDTSSDDDDDADDLAMAINHSEAISMLDKLLNYFERQSETNPAELLLLKRLRDHTAEKRETSLRRKK